jgi:hypothetical protein
VVAILQSTQHTIEVDPNDENVSYASIGSGILRSTDGASTWHRRSDVMGNRLAIDPHHSDEIYINAPGEPFTSVLFPRA